MDKKAPPLSEGGIDGAGDATRTRDHLHGKQMLYQLSYSRERKTPRIDLLSQDPAV